MRTRRCERAFGGSNQRVHQVRRLRVPHDPGAPPVLQWFKALDRREKENKTTDVDRLARYVKEQPRWQKYKAEL